MLCTKQQKAFGHFTHTGRGKPQISHRRFFFLGELSVSSEFLGGPTGKGAANPPKDDDEEGAEDDDDDEDDDDE